MYSVQRTIDARDAWSRTTGRSVDLAVLDTGVTPVGHQRHRQGCPRAGRELRLPAAVDADATANPSKPGDTSHFMGVAPDARIVSVKVADAWGNADVSQVIAGIDWVVQNRKASGLSIRVLNLSLGTPSTQKYTLDPLAHGAEQAWHNGIVLVASAGNNARGDGQLLNPAYDPYLLAVGASDSRGTVSGHDDLIPDLSSRGDGERYLTTPSTGTDWTGKRWSDRFWASPSHQPDLVLADRHHVALLELPTAPRLDPPADRHDLLLEQRSHVRPLVDEAGELEQLAQPDAVVPYLHVPDPAHPVIVPVAHPCGAPGPLRLDG
jgi:hypothetical protein